MEITANLNKKRERRNTKGRLLIFLLFFLLFPYILSMFGKNDKEILKKEEQLGKIWIEEKHFWGIRQIEMEEYLAGMLAGTIPSSFEPETLKAQAMILRSYCVSLAENKEGRKIIPGEKVEDYYISKKDRIQSMGEEGAKEYRKIEEAVKETEGKILLSNHQVTAPPFFLSGNGRTRDIADYPQAKEEFGYLKSVACQHDMETENYSSYKELEEKQFEDKIKKYFGKKKVTVGKIILYRDKSEYVKMVEIGGQQINGEEFRDLFELNSSCFGIEKINHKILFKTKGKGHGFGFSQFQANELAKEGMKAEEILNYFFEGLVMEKI